MERLILTLSFVLISLYRMAAADPEPVLPAPGWLFSTNETVAADYSSFCQDPDGFLWIGTDRGLLRFDGTDFDLYTTDTGSRNSLSDNRILGLMCNSKGRIWVATANGLCMYRPLTDDFVTVKLADQNFPGYIISLGEQADGTVTFIVSGRGLYTVSWDDGVPVGVRYLFTMPEEKNVNGLVCAPDGRIYASTNTGRVLVIERNGQISGIDVTREWLQAMVIESDNVLLVADACHIYRVRTDGSHVSRLEEAAPINIHCLSRCVDGGVRVGTSGSGLWHIEPGADMVKPVHNLFSPFLNISTANIGAIYCSPDGNLWLGCNYKGVVMFPANRLPFSYRPLSGYFNDFQGGLRALAVVGENVVIGLDGGRIAVMSPAGDLLRSVYVPGRGCVSSLTPLGNGKVAVGVENEGVWELSVADGKFERLLDIDGNFLNVQLAPGNKDELFIAVYGRGVMRYDRKNGNKTWLPVKPDTDRLTNSYVTQMLRTGDDKVWMALYGGLACFDLKGDSILAIDQKEFLPGTCFSLAEGKENTVWVGTTHGLVHYDPVRGIVGKLGRNEGLADDDIRSIVTDKAGVMWIGTLHGLSSYNPADGTVRTFRNGYGMVENVMNNLAVGTGSGNIYSSGEMGYTMFSPRDSKEPDFTGPVKITGIFLNGKRLSPEEDLDGQVLVKGHPMTPESIHLPYRENSIRLRLSTLDFRIGMNLHYCWKLDGVPGDWNVLPQGDNMVNLPHLDPGTYTLKLKAEENGVESEITAVKIVITPPWYLTWWTKLFLFIIIAVACWLVYHAVRRRRFVRESEERIRFFMDISHDIRSPITLILNPLESILRRTEDPGTKEQLQVMRRNALRILSLVNQLLDIRKLEKGKANLSCRLTDMNDFVGQLVEMFIPQAREKDINLSFEPSPSLPDIWVDRTNVDKILVNLISNAIKYTPKGGEIKIETSLSRNTAGAEYVDVRVLDTGVGLDAKTESKLFERFYQGGRDNAVHNGFGIGLDLCRRLTELHHGRISGANRKDGIRGSVFTLSLPVDASCYNSDQLLVKSGDDETTMSRYVILPPEADSERRDALHPGHRGRKVLVVDDDDELRRYLVQHLSRRFKVRGAADGKEALRMIAEDAPDVIVSDVKMPGMDGLALLRSLKSNGNHCHIPVILLSSLQDISDRMAGWDRGADGYLGKPFHEQELEAMIDNALDSTRRVRVMSDNTGKGNSAEAGDIEGDKEKGKDINREFMELLTRIIEENVSDPAFNVEKLSAEVGMSRTHLHRRMKEMLGMTPSDFIRTIRMRLACRLLTQGDLNVSEVGFKLGFNSHSHFTTVFKNFTGFTPSEYQNKK